MKTLFRAHAVRTLVCLGFACTVQLAKAEKRDTCDSISKDVREAVSKNPSKVLMIVEDALVMNETCACEITKAAISASKADAALVNQIVQTAIAIVPKMSAVIAECAGVAPGTGNAVTVAANATSDAKNPSSVTMGDAKNPGGKVAPAEPVTITEGTDFSDAWATNIRGVYLIQPASAGYITQVEVEEVEVESDDTSNSRRTRNRIPLSPAMAHP